MACLLTFSARAWINTSRSMLKFHSVYPFRSVVLHFCFVSRIHAQLNPSFLSFLSFLFSFFSLPLGSRLGSALVCSCWTALDCNKCFCLLPSDAWKESEPLFLAWRNRKPGNFIKSSTRLFPVSRELPDRSVLFDYENFSFLFFFLFRMEK